jgi:CDP-diacylglycerol--serine O-phosphatidyltransferase
VIAIFVLIAILMVSTIRYSKPQVAMRGRFSKEKLMVAGLLLFLMILLTSIFASHILPYLAYGFLIFYVFSGILSLLIQFIQEF